VIVTQVATRIWNFPGGKIDDFKGNYEEFSQYTEQQAATQTASRSW
jgi:ATPase subunit of ABC transporter with duplicated ATPase domains